MGQPVIFISLNYRLGPFGFLGGSGPASENNTNVGLHDQCEALKWIQDNIADFGGDPTKVTLFGESAGAISTAHHMVAYGGDNNYKGNPLFSSAILQSGGVLAGSNVTSVAPQQQYQHFIKFAGCDGKSSDSATMACLRSLPSSKLVEGFNSYGIEDFYGYITEFFSYSPRPDGDIIPDDAYTLVKENKIAPVPFISGTNEDDGTIFGLVAINITTNGDLRNWTEFLFPQASSDTIYNLLDNYPNDFSAGCPYRRGILDGLTLEYKRLSSIFNDFLFKAPSRYMLQSSKQKCWSFQSSVFHDVVPILGTFHTSDLLFQYNVNLGPSSSYLKYWIAFANHHDPNVGSDLPNWKEYSEEGKEMLDIGSLRNAMSTDDAREGAIDFLVTDTGIRI